MTCYDEKKIENIFCEVLGLPAREVTDSLSYNSCVHWDSLKHLQLVAMLEETFDIEIEMDDIIAMETFGKLKVILQKYLT